MGGSEWVVVWEDQTGWSCERVRLGGLFGHTRAPALPTASQEAREEVLRIKFHIEFKVNKSKCYRQQRLLVSHYIVTNNATEVI